MEVKKVGVLGCGLMGSGIAQVSAVAGYDVTVLEQEQKFLEKGFAGIEKSLAKFAEKGNLKEPVETVRGRLKGTTSPDAVADCDICGVVCRSAQSRVEHAERLKNVLRAIGVEILLTGQFHRHAQETVG